MSDYFLSELSERSEKSPFLQHTSALAEILHFVQDDKKEKQDDRSDAQKFVTLSECEESSLVTDSRINADPSLTLRMTKKTG
ncbi:MAG: hypothetical protein J7M12_02115 [Candidatus Hydrogenedentes bacterium]|nr:hypothetical protein [Candidatus Hydrogenedentota bacterium]